MTTEGKPRIIFDTTGIDRLEDSDAADALTRGFESLEIVLTATSAEEIIQNAKDPARREALLTRFGHLLGHAMCIWPPQEVLRLLISGHVAKSSRFDWLEVDVRAVPYEEAISRRDFDEELVAEQLKRHYELQDEFEKMWKALRPKLDPIFARQPKKRPALYEDAVEIARMPGGVLWGFGEGLYAHIAGKSMSESEAKAFMEACPPFSAACYGLVMAWFNWSLRPTHDLPALPRRNDLMMAVYLAYCARFVTEDWAQQRDLGLVAKAAGLPCEVTSFKEFSGGFLIGSVN